MLIHHLLLLILAISHLSSALIHSYNCGFRRRSQASYSSALSARRERRTAPNPSTSTSSPPRPPAAAAADKEAQQLIISTEEIARRVRTGQARARLAKSVRRENRISVLENLDINLRSDAQQAELDGLLQVRENFEEQYDATTFSDEHVEFKRFHNEAFVALARYCQRDRDEQSNRLFATTGATDDGCVYDAKGDPNVFYLDGPDAATSSLLIDGYGFDPSSCYVANRHTSTCDILQNILPKENVIHATASEALSLPPIDNDDSDPSFSGVDFSAYYFDGCGGFTPHIIGMMTAALIRPEEEKQQTTAVGYSLMGGNKDVVQKELDICRALTTIASTRGMRTRHVLDDPMRYGIPNEISKTEEGGTFTSWMLLEAE